MPPAVYIQTGKKRKIHDEYKVDGFGRAAEVIHPPLPPGLEKIPPELAHLPERDAHLLAWEKIPLRHAVLKSIESGHDFDGSVSKLKQQLYCPARDEYTCFYSANLDRVRQHPLLKTIDPKSEAAVIDMEVSLLERGQQMPCVMLDGQLLDGRLRYAAARFLGWPFKLRVLAENCDPVRGLVDLHHLTELNFHQRALIGARIMAIGEYDIQQVAHPLHILPPVLRDAMLLHEHLDQTLLDAVRRGFPLMEAGCLLIPTLSTLPMDTDDMTVEPVDMDIQLALLAKWEENKDGANLHYLYRAVLGQIPPAEAGGLGTSDCQSDAKTKLGRTTGRVASDALPRGERPPVWAVSLSRVNGGGQLVPVGKVEGRDREMILSGIDALLSAEGQATEGGVQ